MLFKEIHLAGIKSGAITLAFRKWKQAAVKEEGLIKTSVGLIKILRIEIIQEEDITQSDAMKAGYASVSDLVKTFRNADTGKVYRISVCYHSEDPRIALREQMVLEESRFELLKEKLERLDRFSKHGSWTHKMLCEIRTNPHERAADLSSRTGFDKEWLKLNIRKLKNLGLTMSHTVGYEISPLGQAFLEKLSTESGN